MVSPIRTSAWIQIDELIHTHSNSDVKVPVKAAHHSAHFSAQVQATRVIVGESGYIEAGVSETFRVIGSRARCA